METAKISLMALSAQHSAAVGAYGQLYVWGRNDFYHGRVEDSDSQKSKSFHSDENESEEESKQTKGVIGKLGFVNNEHEVILEPTYFSLTHMLYKVNAAQVACGVNFTAVVAVEKPNVLQDPEDEDTLFALETDDRAVDFVAASYRELTRDQFECAILSNKMRTEITEYLAKHNVDFMSFFKSRIIKEYTFMDLMKNQIKSCFQDEDIKRVITHKKMRLPGNDIKLKPLYELIMKTHQGEGILYLIGTPDILPKDTLRNPVAHTVRENNLSFHIVNLPTQLAVKKVACGENYVLILGNNGMVYSWGEKFSYALGKNRASTYDQIRAVSGLVTEKTKIIDVVSGYSHCIALNDSGIVMTWGDGAYGKLGNGRFDPTSRPEPINLNSKEPLMIKAYGNSSFCLMKDDSCYIWGENNNKKFGPDFDRPYYDKCMQITFKSSGLTDIAIGKTSVVYIDKGGFLNQVQDIGETPISKRHKSLEGSEFYQVTCYDDTYLAISTKGSIFSWSLSSEHPALGHLIETSISTEISSCAQQFPVLEVDTEQSREITKVKSTKVVSCCCSDENTYLITDKGEVLIAGSNEYGQMGIAVGDLEMYEKSMPDVFQEFILVPRLSKAFKMTVDSLATGFHHVLALSSGKVFAWGSNNSGQLGLGFFSTCEKYPIIIQDLEREHIIQAATGLTHSLVLTKEGNLYAFGSAESGKLGLGRLANSVCISSPKIIKGISKVIKISCSVGHSIAINQDKRMFTWGENWKGQLGNGHKENEYEPEELLGLISWEQAACGVNHSLGISSEHKIYHWGRINMANEDDELLQPTIVKGLEEIYFKAAYAADGFSVGLVLNEASIYSWGKQAHHRIAGAKPDVKPGDKTKHTMFSITNEKIHSFSCADLHCCIVTDQNSVFNWGYSANGRLGDPDFDGEDKIHNGLALNMIKYFGVVDKDSEEVEDVITDLQLMLQNEPEELTESNIREVDKQIMMKFTECIEEFIKLTEDDEKVAKFMEKIQYKMLMRLQQKPIECSLIENRGVIAHEVEDKLTLYGSLITTFQIHPCYAFKLLFKAKLKQEQRLEMLNLVYSDMENNEKLVYTCIYLSQMILKKTLEVDEITFEQIFDNPVGQIYKELVVKMILASSQDMLIMRELVIEMLLNLSNQVNQDDLGIDIDPCSASKNTSVSNKITAYQNNRNTVDRRMNKLATILAHFAKSFQKLKPNSETDTTRFKHFSPFVNLIIRDFLSTCAKKFSFKLAKFDYQLEHIKKIAHTILDMIFAPVCKAINSPYEYFIVIENKAACSPRNLSSLCKAIQSFFSGKPIEDSSGDRWLNEINEFNTIKGENIRLKVEIIEYLYNEKQELEELFLVSLFNDSLAQFDRIVSVNGRNLIKLQKITEKNLEALRVNNPSYDALIFICKELGPAPSFKVFNPSENVNLTLFTRALRQDQSIVRCPQCQMLISRDMAPSDFKTVIEIYDPMPPNSPQFLFTKILATSCKKLTKERIDNFLKKYEVRCERYIKDYQAVENVRYLLNLVDTNIAAENEIPIETTDSNQLNFIEKQREIVLRKLEEECKKEYIRRRSHRKIQERLTRIFNKLLDMLTHFKKENFFNLSVQKELLFNVEYGGCNRDLEAFSDSVMFSIYLNKIRDYTMKKDMSISLYESLKGEMNSSLRGFMKRNLNELMRKHYFDREPLIPVGMREKDIVFSFEIDRGELIIIVANSPSKLNICGRDEYRHEEILIYAKINSDEISKLRDDVKKGIEDSPKIITNNDNTCVVPFNKGKILYIVGTIEDKIAAYYQNISIAQLNDGASSNPVSHRKEKSDVEIDQTSHDKM